MSDGAFLLAQANSPSGPTQLPGVPSAAPGALPNLPTPPPGAEPQERKPNEMSHPDWPVWNCKLEPLRNLEKPLTVGEKQLLSCEGSSITPVAKIPQFLFQDDLLIYSLHPLELRKSDANSVELVVTSYKPGEIEYGWIEVADGETGFRIEKLTNKVESLLPPGQQTQPNMNVPAFQMAYPLWMWVSLLLVVLIPSLILIMRLRRRAQIKKLVEKLSVSNSALRPYDQFSKDMRALVRNYNYHAQKELAPEFIAKLNELFKAYLTRAFRLPALVWGPGTLTSEIKRKNKKTYKDILDDLKNTMLELNKTEQSGKASPEDADQLKKLTMVLAERIFKIQEDKANR